VEKKKKEKVKWICSEVSASSPNRESVESVMEKKRKVMVAVGRVAENEGFKSGMKD